MNLYALNIIDRIEKNESYEENLTINDIKEKVPKGAFSEEIFNSLESGEYEEYFLEWGNESIEIKNTFREYPSGFIPEGKSDLE